MAGCGDVRINRDEPLRGPFAFDHFRQLQQTRDAEFVVPRSDGQKLLVGRLGLGILVQVLIGFSDVVLRFGALRRSRRNQLKILDRAGVVAFGGLQGPDLQAHEGLLWRRPGYRSR